MKFRENIMPRKNIYFKDKIDREIHDILEIDLQKGATTSDMNYSSIVNELVRLGLMVYKSKEEGNLSISKVSDATSLRKSQAHVKVL
jgi:hypothetical protein